MKAPSNNFNHNLSGYGGARVARKIPAPVLHWGIVTTGLVMAGLFFAKG